MTKYRAKKTTVDGITFDSQAEAARWRDLCLLERAGRIRVLCRQVPYVLAPAAKLHGEKRKRPAVRYLVDFEYFSVLEQVLIREDVKGMDTPMSRLKRHLMATVHGISVRVVK
ncbi:MAG: DUF1064 domain-containing protein [Pseudomonadota bacterium]